MRKISGLVILTSLAAVPSLPGAAILTSVSGADAASIQSSVDAFRNSIGSLNANVAGSFVGGRREINWDGVPDNLSAPNNLPANFFNSNSPRGAVFASVGGGTGFQVSANSGSGTPVLFGNLQVNYPSQFQTFSSPRLFTSLGSNVMDVLFFVPGSNTPAGTTAFGAVFTDVDQANVTSLQFFSANNTSLGQFFVPVAAQGLSFVGVRFNAGEQIARVRITSGTEAIGGPDNSSRDIVVMDDFIYAEPFAIPEPGSLFLLSSGLAGFLAWRRLSARC